MWTLVLFFSNFRFISDRCTIKNKKYEHKLFHQGKFQISSQKGSSYASYLLGLIEIETLFLAFSPVRFFYLKLSR